ncbi:hypothetical protein PMAYCL1PPCAC_14360, partial [Pristionchus mayeri]
RRRAAGCAVVYYFSYNSTAPVLAIKLDQISTCLIEMKQNNDLKSLEIATIISIAFDQQLMTSGDRSFAVHYVCTQQQMTVATNVDFISDITPSAVLGGTATPPSLSLSITTQDGSSLDDVKLGTPLMLVWTLEQRPSHLFGLRVLGCNAMTSSGEGMRVIDNSCSIVDQALVSDLRYSEDATKAFADLRAFKFPDSDEIVFQCAVRPCLIKFDHLQLEDGNAAGQEDLCTASPDCSRLFPSSSSSSPVNRTRRMSDLDSLHPAAHILDTRLTLTDEYGSLRIHQGPTFFALRSVPQEERCISSVFAYSVILGCSIIILISVVAITVLRRKDRS